MVNEVEASEYLEVKISTVDDAVREGLKVSASMKNTWVITMGSQDSVICSEGKSMQTLSQIRDKFGEE